MIYGVYVSVCVCVRAHVQARAELTSKSPGHTEGRGKGDRVETGGLGPWQGCALSDDHKTQAQRDTGPNKLPARTRCPDMPIAGPRLSLDRLSGSSRGRSWALRCTLPLAGSQPPPSWVDSGESSPRVKPQHPPSTVRAP